MNKRNKCQSEQAIDIEYIALSYRGGFGNSWSSIFTFHTSEYDPTRVYGYFHSEHDNSNNAVVCRDVGAGRYLGVSALSSIRFFSKEGRQFKGTLRLYKTKSGACID